MPREASVKYEQVAAAATKIRDTQGGKPRLREVHAAVGGRASMTTVLRFLQRWLDTTATPAAAIDLPSELQAVRAEMSTRLNLAEEQIAQLEGEVRRERAAGQAARAALAQHRRVAERDQSELTRLRAEIERLSVALEAARAVRHQAEVQAAVAATLEAIRAGQALRRGVQPLAPTMQSIANPRRRKKLSAAQAAVAHQHEINRAVIERHYAEIRERDRRGDTRTATARWLESLHEGENFEGKATTLNGYLGPRQS